ncbi:hypothetical protein Hypma_004248 [Hypsizygus marmoreus]|uniref:Uncharacterized protein n=1 Tax=Hypsizygus marmoreus TaxID=39966 RepID=A0A369J7T6_HYPMA|nr:hypothetical protein Hypma_004248 [Hypsizygus marmoreus]
MVQHPPRHPRCAHSGLYVPLTVKLSIDEIHSFPIPIFSLDINVMHLELTGVTLVDFTDDCPNATSTDYSRMTAPTLEILFRTPSRVNALIDLPHSFVSRIKHLIIYDTDMTVWLANRIMTNTMNSLESLQIRNILKERPTNWFECDFTLLRKLNHIEFYVILGHRGTENFQLLASAALSSIIDFFTKNPTAARIRRFSIRFIRFWGTGPIPDWRPYLDNLAAISSWHEVDRILDGVRGSTSMLAKFIVSLGLGLTQRDSQRYLSEHPDDLEWRRSIDEMQIAWQEKVHAIMPLASRWGVLVARNILDVET